MSLHSAGLQYLLPATWTALSPAGIDLGRLSHLLSTNPAHLAGLKNKGLIAKDFDADLVVSVTALLLFTRQSMVMT